MFRSRRNSSQSLPSRSHCHCTHEHWSSPAEQWNPQYPQLQHSSNPHPPGRHGSRAGAMRRRRKMHNLCLCAWSAEGKGEGVQPGVHVPSTLRCREGVQCKHAGHSTLPGISATKSNLRNLLKEKQKYWTLCFVSLPVICEGLHDLHHQTAAGVRLHAWLRFPLCCKQLNTTSLNSKSACVN